ncbi:transcription factor E4F1 [Aplochiton taeniatus]
MNVENNNTAETESEQTNHGNNIITIQTTIGDEDEDVHKCGRCQSEFSTLEAFIQHKLHQNCKRSSEVQGEKLQDDNQEEVSATDGTDSFVAKTDGISTDDSDKSNFKGEDGHQFTRGRRKRGASSKDIDHPEGNEDYSPDCTDPKLVFKLNREGRYICQMCDKTFKTTNILRTHMSTHSEQKNFSCELCGMAFRTKGSLIRHNRRHTDERPYRCSLCGLSFRESGALTRHLKSITPCTEKIRFQQCKEILVGKDGIKKDAGPAQLTDLQEVEQQHQDAEEAPAEIVSMWKATSQEVIHEVHFQVEVDGGTHEQQVVIDQPTAKALAAGDNLICQAIINSGIALETEGETVVEQGAQPVAEGIPKAVYHMSDAESRLTDIQITEECVEMETEEEGEETEDTSDGQDEQRQARMHVCPHCSRSFKGLNYLRFHVKGHLGHKPFKCEMCEKEFVTGYLLKKHMEVHVSERRYKCGECGKLYKTIGHVREHMRSHSDERPYHCSSCNKGYKTKNALMVHQRTHAQEKPYVCQFCLRGFREKGSLVRHIRHHTGEKPYKCAKCGRGFAEHGTLNRHLRAKGGCQKEGEEHGVLVTAEEQAASLDGLATAAGGAEDPHAVLVEFSSVVADTQEYIIGTPAEEVVQGEEVTLIQDTQNQMGTQIMKVVQQLVSQSRGAGIAGHQIIVRNVTALDPEGGAATATASISDCGDTITIATPESLTEQVAMTLASAINDGTLLGGGGEAEGAARAIAVVTASEGPRADEAAGQGEAQAGDQQQEFVIASEEEVEIQTVVV